MMKWILAMFLTATTMFSQDMTDLDADGLPDVWEMHFGLSTNRAIGIDGPFGDPDNDGLSNYAEFMAGYWEIEGNIYSNNAHALPGLSPTNAYSITPGVLDAYIRPTAASDCLRFTYTDADFCDDFWELTNGLSSVDLYDDHRILPEMGWLACRRALFKGQRSITLKVSYYGKHAHGDVSDLHVWFYSNPTMSGAPTYKTSFSHDGMWGQPKLFVLTNQTVLSFLPSSLYVMAFLDENRNSVWNEGEVLGVGQRYPLENAVVGTPMNITLTDIPSTGLRLEIPAKERSNIRIKRVSVDGNIAAQMDNIATFTVYGGRNWIQESDWLGEGKLGLDWGLAGVSTLSRLIAVYRVAVDGVSAYYTFTNYFNSTRPKASLIYPSHNSVINKRRLTFRWRLDQSEKYVPIASFGVYVEPNAGGTVVYANTPTAANTFSDRLITREADGSYSFTPDFCFANGIYRWKVHAYDDKFNGDSTEANWSSNATFTVANREMSPSTAGAIDVKLFYSGKTFSGNFVVGAYKQPHFGSVAESVAQVAYTDVMTNMLVGLDVRLNLLDPGKYFVMAWKDTTANQIRDIEEPWGYYNWLGVPGEIPFNPRSVIVPISGTPSVINVVVEDLPGTSRR